MSLMMSFDGYFERTKQLIIGARSLEDLVVYRKRGNICYSGLSYKVVNGRLVERKYTGTPLWHQHKKGGGGSNMVR